MPQTRNVSRRWAILVLVAVLVLAMPVAILGAEVEEPRPGVGPATPAPGPAEPSRPADSASGPADPVPGPAESGGREAAVDVKSICSFNQQLGMCGGACPEGQACRQRRDPESPGGGVPAVQCICGDRPHRAGFPIGQAEYFLDGESEAMDAASFVDNDRAYVPVRYLAYGLGLSDADLQYQPKAGSISLNGPGTTVRLTLGRAIIEVNGREQAIDVPPVLIDGRTYLPARYVAEALGYQVGWDPEAKMVTIAAAQTVIDEVVKTAQTEYQRLLQIGTSKEMAIQQVAALLRMRPGVSAVQPLAGSNLQINFTDGYQMVIFLDQESLG